MRSWFERSAATLAALVVFAGSAPAQEAVYVVTVSNVLEVFDSAAPASVVASAPITGLQAGENILAIDFRPAAPVGRLYGLGSSSRVYQIDPASGVATAIGGGPFTPALNGSEFGFDFNPTVDRIRVVSDNDQNLRLHPDLGTVVATDSTLNYAAGDLSYGEDPYAVAVAYTNSVDPPPAATTLYDIDTVLNILTTQSPPNNGTLNTIGPLGANPNNTAGFDISGASGMAYAALNSGGTSSLFRIDLGTGSATLVGTIGSSATVRGLSVFGSVDPTPIDAASWGKIKGLYRQ